MARPKLKPSQRKSTFLRVRLTKAERELILSDWKMSGEKTITGYLRRRLLGKNR